MRPYELRRAIRQTAIIQRGPDDFPPTARYFGGLLRFAAGEILALLRNYESVSLITVKGHVHRGLT